MSRQPIDFERARSQHQAYENALRDAGWQVLELEPKPDAADGVFVEDCAVVVDELGILTNPGAESRRAEVESVGAALQNYRSVISMPADATLDGGDVLRMDRTVFVGLTARTNEAGLEFMKATLEPLGYSVRGVPLKDALHLKTGVTAIDPETVILNPGWIDAEYFSDYRIVHAHEDEPFGANVLLAGRSLFVAQHHPRTADRCASFTSDLRLVVADELAKAEGGLTCCSILLPAVEAS